MIVVFHTDGTFNYTIGSVESVRAHIEDNNLPYIETDEKLDFTKYTYSLVDGKLVQTEITEVPRLD